MPIGSSDSPQFKNTGDAIVVNIYLFMRGAGCRLNAVARSDSAVCMQASQRHAGFLLPGPCLDFVRVVGALCMYRYRCAAIMEYL